MRMCALLRSERQLCASFRAETSSEQKWARFWLVCEKKVWKAFPAFWDRIGAGWTGEYDALKRRTSVTNSEVIQTTERDDDMVIPVCNKCEVKG